VQTKKYPEKKTHIVTRYSQLKIFKKTNASLLMKYLFIIARAEEII